MQVHDLILVAQLLRQLEQKSHFERTILDTLFSFCLCFFVLTESVQTASLVDVNLLVLLAALDKVIVHLHGLATVNQRESWVSISAVKDKEFSRTCCFEL